ncbi:rhodanese-like domain-containing protein [Fulvivirga sediminis]|uniref:rhodanese-like domain-containing protein n=1 Tax=Fulvivirga sediminis TaxID=2803949 RepID=UPI0019250F0F|nr:rhodanese-like domain-containing protein [Fulvivirga sediminis]
MKAFRNLNSREFVELYNSTPFAILLDVRTEKEFKLEALKGALNIPSTQLDELKKLDKSKSYFIHCRMGGRSAMVSMIMAQEGFSHIYNLNEEFSKLQAQSIDGDLRARKAS